MDSTVMRALRRVTASNLQLGYYRKGLKIKCAAIEGKRPTLRLTWILFNETTAYQADDVLSDNTLPKMGFQQVAWDNGFGEGSTNTWKADDVRQAEFAETRSVCEAVRRGEKSPDTINATVSNPK